MQEPIELACQQLSLSNHSARQISKSGQTLTAGIDAGVSALTVASTAGFTAGDALYVGNLSREGCDEAVIQSVRGGTTVQIPPPATRGQPLIPVAGTLGASGIEEEVLQEWSPTI
jgi:hypothetical protein